ncbi:MAG: class II aldolase/adducin family protein [Sulfurimonas sp.]|uniref:class II aldolase/adducin family protein n=1 Tax=Sulfurimonas sp. TaxID=2022749 RepID=UPI0025EAEA4E|nr:class II aldolase/adducin family protein [Sulfurimonas sp.]MCK9491493.1 class II aldolase/adducin family protein [Sulfurimonas sp.]
MKSLYEDASEIKTDLDLRVYTSRLLGRDSSLVLHGGGNTSVKSSETNLFGESEEILYVKGSGWDLATIEAEGFAPVKMDMLLQMAKLESLSDSDMVKYQRLAMTNPSAPNPSVEAILHAIIPYKFVDHTHADAVVTITNTEDGKTRIKELYGDKVLIIPYIMPGFVLAKLVYEMTKDLNWSEIDAMVLMNHGLFTFSDDAKESYEKTIEFVDLAEKYLLENGARLSLDLNEVETSLPTEQLIELAKIRQETSKLKGKATISLFNDSPLAQKFSKENVEQIATRGPLTPDHVIRTKRVPAILNCSSFISAEMELKSYVDEYIKYFENNKKDEILLNPAPNFAILKDLGSLSFGKSKKEAKIIQDINEHTFEAILKAEKLGGYKALSPSEIFDVEYWELEQAKLKKSSSKQEFEGKIALVSGQSEASKMSAEILQKKGASVVVLGSDESLEKADLVKLKCDSSLSDEVQKALEFTIKNFGGVDLLIAHRDEDELVKQSLGFLKYGVDPSIIMLTNKDEKFDFKESDTTTNILKLRSLNKEAAELVCAIAKNPKVKILG